MTKVIRIITRLNVGGPAIHAILLSKALNEGGYRDILIAGSESGSEGSMRYLAEAEGVEPCFVPSLMREISVTNDLRAFFEILSVIRRERPMIVHTHTAKAGTLGRLAAICAGVPIRIHTFHGHIFDGYFSPVKARVFLWIERILAHFTDRVIVVSDAVREEIVGTLRVARSRRCVAIPLGLDLGRFLESTRRGAFRREIGVDDGVFLVGIVGRLVPIKNHVLFLRAAKEILDTAKQVRMAFVVVGDGELRETLEASARALGIDANVIFTGWRKDLSGVYADLDVVALTSLNEGTPVSLIEAMASARPVVATDVGGVRDIVHDGENGFLVASGDSARFAEAVIRLAADGALRERLGAAGRVSARGRFSKERLANDIKALYDVCLEEYSQKTGIRRT